MRIPLSHLFRLPAFVFAAAACLLSTGCLHRPKLEPEVSRPEQVLDFSSLYKQNCAACHGVNGKNGASLPLANPVYLAFAGQQTIANTIIHGVSGHLMPPFAKSAGGMLTDQQINVLAQGLISAWSTSGAPASQGLPPYAATLTGDPARGQQAFASSCARCHGPNGQGAPGDPKGAGKLGSLVDPAYLTLVSDQYLRSVTVAGMPDRGMPDWRSDAQQPLTDQQITDIVAWLASQRTPYPGQPYPTQPSHP
jgi:cytochrome c oxidase cbb3-type subunit 3/ubiquinol-cytochrome c reductase cytochrome c subunit